MSFNMDRMKKVRFIPAQLNDAVTIHFILDISDEIGRFIPPPLSLSTPPRAHFALNHFKKTTLPGVESYLESALLVEVEYEGLKGNLTLAMILDDDNAMIGGREFFGFPKKMGRIAFAMDGGKVTGSVERRNVLLAQFSCAIGVTVENPSGVLSPFGETCFNIKCFPDPGLRSFDYPPRLVKHKIGENIKGIKKLHDIKLTLNSSKFDPWSELAPCPIIDGYLRAYDSTVLAGEVIAELNGDDYFKYALNRFM